MVGLLSPPPAIHRNGSGPDFRSHHYAFKVSDEEFDGIFARIEEGGVVYGSGPFSWDDGKINTRRGGRGFYRRDIDGHLMEVLTRG